MKRALSLFVLVGAVMSITTGSVTLAAQSPGTASQPTSAEAHSRLLGRYCVTCHNERLRTAGVAFDTMDLSNTGADAQVWEAVIRKLRVGAMPPPGRPRPNRHEALGLVSYLETRLDESAAEAPTVGRTETFHRLNRAEYRNAIRDLLAVDVDVSALLPADDADAQGFDNMASVLSVSPTLLERYLSSARKISRLAVGIAPPVPSVETHHIPLLMYQDDRLSEDLPFGSRGGVAIRHRFPVDGEYSVKLRLQRTYTDYIRGLGTPQQLDVRVDGRRIARFTVGGDAPTHATAAPASFAGNTPLFGHPAWEIYVLGADEDLGVNFRAEAGERVVGISFERRHWETEGVLQPRQTGFSLAINERWQGNAAVDSVEIGGPYVIDGPGNTASRRTIFSCHPDAGDEAGVCARAILSRLARRAYRRPVTDEDINSLFGFYHRRRKTDGFEAGIQLALQRMLTDPEFLFRVERDPVDIAPATSYPVGDVALASRLSFFLWSSIPDDALLELASRNTLSNPDVLEQQVRRMLADPRASALVDNFAGQWLLLRNIPGVTPDPNIFPTFDENLREAFVQETRLFVENVIRADESVVDLLDADYTFVNERLADHYGIPGVYGNRFRRVTLDVQRGGLLGHGGLLTVTSYPNRTSPVLRGKWVLENLLGTPPPPPPPDVPSFPERGQDDEPATVRALMEMHRENPVCAGCHAPMDPLGFALENFDAIGAWRATDAHAPIDASGAMPTGDAFEGLRGLRTLLVNNPQPLVRTVTEKLLSYALGRGMEYYDYPTVRQIAREAAANDYRWSSIVLGIVQSRPFQMRSTGS
ncbi:MAG: DUF1592 domain-containing protein [Acidobacteriota bacterium]|nr:DUF1592 domain-containing protein [Acidobacteriota bacterium]